MLQIPCNIALSLILLNQSAVHILLTASSISLYSGLEMSLGRNHPFQYSIQTIFLEAQLTCWRVESSKCHRVVATQSNICNFIPSRPQSSSTLDTFTLSVPGDPIHIPVPKGKHLQKQNISFLLITTFKTL